MAEFQIYEELNALIDRYREDIVRDTQRLVAYNSIYEESDKPGEPFGAKIAEALDGTLALAAGMGFSTRNVDGYMGVIDMGEPTLGKKIGMIAHIDIVPAGDGWTYPPFAGEIVDGKLYGRGSVDDKGPLVAALYAMKAVQESGLPVSNHARFLIGADEESGFRCIKYYLTKEEQPWGGFSPDGEFPVIYGEKGTYRFRCTGSWQAACDQERFTVHMVKGGTRMNVVPEFASAELGCNDALYALAEQALAKYNPDGRITLKRQGERLTVEAQGISAHAATPWFGLSANNLLLNYLRLLPLAPAAAESYLYALADLFAEGNAGVNIGIACENEEFGALTLSLGVLEVGENGGSAAFDMRYPNLDARAQIWQTVEQNCQARGLAVELLQDKPGLHVPQDSFLVQSLLQAYQQTTGRDEMPKTIGGGTYSRAMHNFVAYGPLFPGQRELAHERDEYISVDDLILCAKIYVQALYNLMK